jgi:hypothetical protein
MSVPWGDAWLSHSDEDNAEIFRTVVHFWSKMYIHTISFFSFADLNPIWYAKMIHKESKIRMGIPDNPWNC